MKFVKIIVYEFGVHLTSFSITSTHS